MRAIMQFQLIFWIEEYPPGLIHRRNAR